MQDANLIIPNIVVVSSALAYYELDSCFFKKGLINVAASSSYSSIFLIK